MDIESADVFDMSHRQVNSESKDESKELSTGQKTSLIDTVETVKTGRFRV
jgi:hypothetical protein